MSFKFLRQPPPPKPQETQATTQNTPQNTTPTPPAEDKIALLKAKLKQNKATAETTTPSIPTAQTTVLVFYSLQY